MDQSNFHDTGQVHTELDRPSPSLNIVRGLPALDDLDLDVVDNLPSDLFSELNGIYGGKLNDLISERKRTLGNQDDSAKLAKEVGGFDGQLDASNAVHIVIQEKRAECSNRRETEIVPASGAQTNLSNRVVELANVDLMPLSWSQVDISVLQQLPEDLRADIVGALPPQRGSDYLTEPNIIVEGVEHRATFDETGSKELAKTHNFWAGDPPFWVHEFKTSNCLMLNALAEMYLKSGSRLLSSTLQDCLCRLQLFGEIAEDMSDEASNSLCELLRQYIQLKLEIDMEEIYVCFLLLKRLVKKYKAFLSVYDIVLPHLQACAGEIYGGSIHLRSLQ